MVRIGFIGCHEISWFCLKKICELSSEYGDEVAIVFNLDETESKKHSAVINFDNLKNEFKFDLHYVKNIAESKNIKLLSESKLDVLFIIGWHRIVPKEVLDTASIKIGIHSSLLPKDRGSSPINWNIIRGETKGGVTLFHLTTAVDSGPTIDSIPYSIDAQDTVQTVYFKASSASLLLLQNNWEQIHQQNIKSKIQNEKEATINERRKPSDGLIDWNNNTKKCYDWIRALTHPYPGAFTYFKNKKLIIWSSQISSLKPLSPGKIIKSGEKIIVSTKDGCLELLKLQYENEPLCNAKLFCDVYGLKNGDKFSSK